ncbi:unnamed protein product [Leptidea sinapis]|uniref:Uncharacterized protein n=1 Tax=Leptidea sinapis TaxID=189913 RepID=A0A5E4QNB1_9NEOP|nr:unnamed protein product [Leptidea sinapis]
MHPTSIRRIVVTYIQLLSCTITSHDFRYNQTPRLPIKRKFTVIAIIIVEGEPNEIQSFLRLKRQLEDLDSDLNTEETQDTKDPSFWDRMIKIALNLFTYESFL